MRSFAPGRAVEGACCWPYTGVFRMAPAPTAAATPAVVLIKSRRDVSMFEESICFLFITNGLTLTQSHSTNQAMLRAKQRYDKRRGHREEVLFGPGISRV